MTRRRRVPFVVFIACLVVAMPFAWGAGGPRVLNDGASASLSYDVTMDVLKVPVTLCHIPPGDPANAKTIVVGQAAAPAHLAHGDSLGECPQACNGVPAPVSKTGQTQCWDPGPFSSPPADCAGTGQDGEYRTGVSVSPRFTDNGDGTVTDFLTGLIWLKNANCFGFRYWSLALEMSNTLASGACGLTDGSVAGDWRLPNIKELQSLIDYGQYDPVLPVGHPFSGVRSAYWSSTTAHDANYAWWVSLENGFLYHGIKIFGDPGGMNEPDVAYVWPVRGGR